MNECHEHNGKEKKSDTKETLLHGSIYGKLQNRQNCSVGSLDSGCLQRDCSVV